MLNHFSMSTGTRAVREIMNGDYIPNNLIQQSYLLHLANAEDARQNNYIESREYYDGLHSAQLTARLKAFLQLQSDKEFNLNLCGIVVDALAEILKVTGFEAGEQGEWLWQVWDDNDLDGEQGRIHTAAVRDGDTYALVEWDNEEGRPSITHELACAGGEGVKVHYSKEKRKKIEFASKRWIIEHGGDSGKSRRLNLYFADHIEKYISVDSELEGNWGAYLELGEGETVGQGVYGACGWHDWTAADGTPLGVPVFHFKNKDQGYDRGDSELSNVIPLQNALNKAVIDMLASADASAFRILFAKGQGWGEISVYPGALIKNEDPESELKALEGEDPDKLIAVISECKMSIAQISRTPISYFQVSGNRPAEETLKQEESGLVGKAEKCQTDFGNVWEQVFKFARRLHNTFGTGDKLDEKQRIECQWKEAQKRNEKELLETLTMKKALGVPERQIWREMGYNDGQILEFEKVKMQAAALAIREEQRAMRERLAVPALPSGQPTGGQNVTDSAKQSGQTTGTAAGDPAKAA